MSDTIYAPVGAEHMAQFAAGDAFAFGIESVDVDRWLATLPQNVARGVFAGGRLTSQMVLQPYTLTDGRASHLFGAIGAVSCPPELRRRGYVEQMLRGACDEMRERGMALAMLHPFKVSFYGRFGWATCMDRAVYRCAPEDLLPFQRRQSGQFTIEDERSIPQLDAIYAQALRGRFGPMVRDAQWWRSEILTTWDGKPRRIAIWRDEQGQGRAYTIYRMEKKPDSTTRMVCREMVALDPVARANLFAFLSQHDSQCEQVEFRAPVDAPVNLLMPNPLRCEVEQHFMLRLVDVEQALASYRFPSAARGTLTLAVADDWLAFNQGVYQIEVADGAAQVRRLPADAPAQISCDVRALAQIYARYLRPSAAAAFGIITASSRDALAVADTLFAGLAPFSFDFF
ncbi:GNAT family N-acetyltransferase [Chloroflexia bacterium SDU3-3]|nr:GNAT family N-acetyltransferase [Chloroflexia bacterium SDU3-3]